MGAETFVEIILAIILPPIGVFLRYGCGRGEAKLLAEDWEGAVADIKLAAENHLSRCSVIRIQTHRPTQKQHEKWLSRTAD
ncbi:hypothetical protein L6452_31749 [Arctium lappa]|uniref:Uncharacterized protein n=1 Tax=Arctium lappa TaxID=4217 RepID=A0ACB8Z3J6_ARCLA|nr:hypothetical protein L6452_31749 [Arctium lappa]